MAGNIKKSKKIQGFSLKTNVVISGQTGKYQFGIDVTSSIVEPHNMPNLNQILR